MKKFKNFKEQDSTLHDKVIRYQLKMEMGEPLDFQDFRFLIEIHEEFLFTYKNRLYEIVWGKDGLEFYRNQTLDYTSEECEKYSSGEKFLECARIDGKKLEEIVQFLEF